MFVFSSILSKFEIQMLLKKYYLYKLNFFLISTSEILRGTLYYIYEFFDLAKNVLLALV